LRPVFANWLLNGKPLGDDHRFMRKNWISRVAGKYRRAGSYERAGSRTVENADARRIRTELDAIRARFPDHA
jgi:hypothetical protein